MLINYFRKKAWRANEIKVLYHTGYYDGALSGILLNKTDKQKYYFECVLEAFTHFDYDEEYVQWLKNNNIPDTDSEIICQRMYAIFKLDEQSLKDIEHNHGLFENTVQSGTNWDIRWKPHITPSPTIKDPKKRAEYAMKHNSRSTENISGELVGFISDTDLYDSRKYNNQIKE